MNQQRGITLALAIEDVPKDIREYAIASYCRRMAMINGVFFFAERIKHESFGCDPLECKMQIFNLQRHIKKGTRRADKRDLIFKENLAISQMSDEDMEQYWFWIPPDELEKIDLKNPRIHFFKEVGWAEPFKDSDANMRRLKMLEDLMTSLKEGLAK